ncbi:hypothetical protein PInf_015936 [Phytophthora infestans]|nr:hypothetical protein PInf_015936 [Phytophthora infestans]
MNRDRFCRASHVNYLILALIFLSIAVANAAFFTPGDVPGPPEKVLVSPASDTSMRVQFYPPLNVKPEGVNGAPVLGYKVEVARRVDEVQTFSVAATGPILSGGYKVTFKNSRGTETTSCIPWNASEVALEMALEELPNVDSVGVSRSVFGAAKNGFVYRVTFDGAYLVCGRQSDLLVGDTTGCQAVQPPNQVLSFEGAHVTSGAPGFYPEVWEIASTESSGAKVLGGTFDLSIGFEGQWINTNPVVTATVAAGSRTAKTVGSMLGVVNRGDRVRIGGEEFTVHATAPFTDSELPLDSYHVRGVTVATAIQVMDTALGNVQVSKTSNLVTTSVSFSSRIADGEQVQIGSKVFKVANVAPTSFTLDSLWTDDTTLHVTAFARKKATLSVNTEVAEMKRALSALPGVGTIDVSRIGPTKANGYRWYVTFQSLDSVRLRVDKKTGTTDFVDVYGVACVTCTVTASVVQDDTQTTTLAEIKGDYSANTVVASTEVGGVVQEVQTISTKASADNISGYFTVSFQSVGGAVINFDDTAADVRTKLQSLATIGRLNVTRSENSDFGATWTVTFLSNMGDLPPLVVTAKTLLKGTGVNVVVQEIVKGVDVALETIIDGLDPGQNYYVRAFARNENGYGASTTDLQQRGRGALPLLTAVSTSPDPPGINGMWPLSGSQLELRLSNPVDHGDSVSKYLFEYAVGDSFGKVATKKVFVFNSIENDITGTFRLQYGDDVTSLLSVHTTASSLQSALNSLSSVRPVSVSRALYVLTGSPSVTFTSANNRLTTPTLSAFQCAMLAKGAGIDVGGKRFIVRVQPVEGSSSIDVELGHGAPDFTANKDLLKLDSSGSERGPYGYIWTISFDNDAGDVVHGKYPGLQFISQLTSIDMSLTIPVSSYGVELGKTGIPADHYGFFEINNDDKVCDTYVVGAPSSVQVVRLFAPTTATDGSFKLKLGSETTADCITLGKSGTLSSLKANLEALDLVSKVTVDEVRAFKVTTTATVTDYDNTGKLTVASAFTSAQVGVLLQDSIIQVSRNPNDFSRHSCEFVVDAPPTAGLTKISVTPRGSCDYFTDEARVLKISDFHDYHVRFWGYYPTGEWPTLQFDYSEFGKGTCTLWAPPNLQVYGQIHTVKYEGVCSKGQAGVQTILADASSTIGGTFTLSYMGEVTSPLSFKDTGAGEMRDAIDSITAPGTVNVSVSQYGAYGKAWHVTFSKHQDDEDDAIFIQHSRLTGQNALISVYPTVTVFTDAKRDDISGSFRIAISGETTEPIGFSATHMKVTQELQKLSVVDSVVALGDKSAGDVGAYALELTADATAGSSLLTNIKLGGAMIDPTRFLAIGETLVLGSPSASYTVKAMTLSDITLFTVFPVSATSANYDVLAGLITKQIKPLPGYVGISALIQVVAVTKGSNEFQMPADHEFSSTINNVFFVGNTKFTVAGVTGAKVTTNVPYPGDTIAAASPKVYVFDNRLQTTEDLRKLVKVGDDLWLPSVSADMNKYTVTAVNKRYLEVSGGFTESITRTLAYHVSNGRKWNLVFRSYDGSLDTIDAIPEHDWRGTDARIGTRSPKAVSPNVISVGNPASTQTIHLEVRDVAIATPYTLSFGGETVLVTGTTNAKNIPWATINDDLKNALETLDSVDGVSVVSTVNGGTVIHTVSFWGTYPMKKLPLLVVTPATANLNAYVQGNNAVAVTKQDNLILESSRAYAFRIFVLNSRGISDSVSVFEAQTSASSVVPTPPTGVALGEFHGSTWLSLNYWAPFYSGGAQVSMFRIEWDSSPNFDSSSNDYGVTSIQETYEVQQVTTSYRTAGAGGTFALSWGGRKTSALPFDCSESEMTDALAIITGTVNVAVDPVLVKRDKVAFGFTWKITFLHNKGDLAPLAADGRQLTGDSPRISVMELVQGFSDLATGDFTHEVQDVVTDGVSPITGSFTLTFNGKNTGTILVSASAFEMQAVLQATTASYSIKVTKTAQTAALNTAIWSVTFAYLRGEEMVGAGNIFTMTVASSQLMGTDAVVRVANKVTGSDPFRFTVTDLRPGVKYYAHVMAYNADGFGSANSPLASAVTCSQPPAPKTVTASVVDGTTLQVDWSASTVGELCSVDKYKVDWYRSEGTQEQQTITTSAGKGIPEIQSLVNFADSQTLGGYFKLSFGGEVSENIRWDAPATGLNSVKERLERLSTVGTVDVSKAESMRVIGGLLVTATSTTVAVHGTATTTIGGSKLAQGDVIWINGNKRTINAAVGVTDTTLTIDTALDITVPVPVYKSAYGYEWTITFLGGHVGPQELIQVSPSDRWTGDKAGIAVDSVQKGLQPISGTFRVAFSSGGLSDSTPPLPHNISALDMKTALENLVTIGAVNVARSTNGYGFNWVITFVSEFKNDISLLSVDGTELQGPGAKILAARTLNGVQPSWYCERNGATDVPVEIGVPGQLRYVIPGLKTGEKYTIRVRAHNSEGYGYAGSIRPTFQIPRTIPSAPQAVELLALSSRLVKLRWDVPISNGGAPISSYQIQWATSADFTNPMRTDYLVSSTDTAPFYYNIPVASAGKYYVRVFAVNSQGDGAFAVPSPSSITPVDRTPGRPEDPTAKVLSSYAILVEWKPSSTEKTYYGGDGGLPITQYMVEWDASAGFDSPPAFGLVDGTKRSFIIGGDDAVTGVRSEKLTAGSTYSIRVTAFNAKDQPPSSPQNLKLSVVTSKSVKAEWMNPLYDGGASLKSYLVEWDEQDDFSSGQSSSATIPIIREMQSVTLQNDVVNEEQFVDATVKVTNEEQVVRTTFTGVDEVQVITTTNSVVVDEVQTVVTTATDRNEVQELRLDGDDVDENALIDLANVDKVDVTRTQNPTGPDLTYVYTIVFSGLEVGGNVPTLGIDAAVTVGGNAVSGIPTQAVQTTAGSELDYASSAVFTVKYTCESYSDPNAITTFSTACTPGASARICAGCVTSFLGGIFTVAGDLTADTYVVSGAKLIAGVCSFEAGTVTKTPTSTTIVVAANDVGLYCSEFSGKTLNLYKTPQMSRDIPLKTAATTISSASVVEGLLTGAIDSATVARSEFVDDYFVGSVYTLTIRRRSVYSPTGNKWSGGFTWQITFSSRGGNIPKMVTRTVVGATKTLTTPTNGAPTASVEDATHPLDPFANSRDGNQVLGALMLKFRDVTSTLPCRIGVDTSLASLDVSVRDTVLESFIITNLKIPTIEIMRSAATQAIGFTWTISFSDASTGGDVGLLQIGNQLGGDFQLSFNGETTAPIAFNAEASEVQTELNKLEKMDNVGDVAVTRGDVVTNTGGYSWTVTFLRDASDASHACEQLEEAAGSLLCNAPGNVPEMVPISATTWLGLSILLPWNADENLVERQLEAAATNTGRQVSVKRTEHGKYGEMSWLVRFISNPTFTPPGAGDLPDITTTFAAEAGSSKYDMTVTQVTPGSKGLSGSFLLDFHFSSFGPREIFFDEDPDRLQRKLNEMDTVGRVTVKRYKYPSSATGCTDPSCSGGWDDVRVKNRGTRGGYRWRIRFMQATGDYKGFTFPPGSGDVASLSVSRSALQGTGVSVDVYTNVPGSSPSVGAFALNTSESQTPALPYSSSAEEMKLGIEAMDLFGEVDVTQGYLLTQKIPGATATLTQDGVTATITGVDDIRQYIARTDIIRFGSTSVNNLVGTNGDAPFTGLIDTSRVKVTARSPVVVANAETTRLLYPGMQLRIDGLVYNVQRTGHEVQTLTATRPSTTWSTAYVTNAFQLTMTRNGVTKPPTNCLRFNEDAATVQAAIFGLLFAFDTSATSGDVLVSRVGPSTFGSRIGYVYSVYFTGESVAGDVAPLKVDYCAGIGDATVTAGVITHGGKIPQQRLMLATDYGQVEDTKGFFQLVLNSQSSACIKWGAPASDVELALEKTPLSAGNVVVTRSGNGTSQTEIQRIRMTANTAVTASTVHSKRTDFRYVVLEIRCSAEDLEVALNGLSNLGTLNNIDHINVTRTGDGGADWGYGYEYLIHFQGPISGGTSRVLGDVPQLVIGNVGTGACSSGAQDGMYPALMIETVRQGAPGFTYDIFFMDYKAAPTVNLMSLKSKDNGDNVCLDGWAQKGGSVRKAYVEMVELGGSSEVQVVTVKDTGTGSYAITFGGQTSPCLLFTASANDVATAIQTLTGSGVGDILVSLDKDLLVSPDRAIYRITFVGDAVTGKLPLLGAVQNSDTACANTVATTNIVVEGAVEGGGPSGEFALTTAYDGENPNSPHTAHSVSQQFRVMDEQFEIQQLVVSNPSNNFVSGETYTLKVLGTNTNPIPWDVSETALQLELTSTARIALTPTVVGANDLIVTRRTNADVAPHGFIYTIYFSGSSVTGNVAAITVVQQQVHTLLRRIL